MNTEFIWFNLKAKNLDPSYLGIIRFTVPTGKISIDFPQNLFFHLTSERQKSEKTPAMKNNSLTIEIFALLII